MGCASLVQCGGLVFSVKDLCSVWRTRIQCGGLVFSMEDLYSCSLHYLALTNRADPSRLGLTLRCIPGFKLHSRCNIWILGAGCCRLPHRLMIRAWPGLSLPENFPKSLPPPKSASKNFLKIPPQSRLLGKSLILHIVFKFFPQKNPIPTEPNPKNRFGGTFSPRFGVLFG